jgi:hypothetical protein
MSGTTCGTCQRKIPTSPAGLPGKNAYTFLTASFTMPTAGNFVTVTVSNYGQFGNRWATIGQIIFVENAGHFQVEDVIGTNQLQITNLDYDGNANSGTTIASGGYISPAGLVGIAGPSGSNGVNGLARLYRLLTTQTTATTFSWQALGSYTVPANTLVNDGDSLVIEAWMVQSGSISLGEPSRRITFAGQSATIFGGIQEPKINLVSTNSALLRIEIIKTSVNTATSRIIVDTNISLPSVKYTVALTALDFTVSNPLVLSVFQVVASGTELRSLTVDKIASI